MPSGSSQPKTLCCCFSLCDVLLLRSLGYWLFPQFYQKVLRTSSTAWTVKSEAKERNAFVTQECVLQLWFLCGAKAPHALPLTAKAAYAHGLRPRNKQHRRHNVFECPTWQRALQGMGEESVRAHQHLSRAVNGMQKREREKDSRSPRFLIIHALLLYIYTIL